jgi:hypothetical protein
MLDPKQRGRAEEKPKFSANSDAKASMIYGNDRAPVTSARQAVEALFAPKPSLDKSPVSEPGQPAGARKPRVLPALTPAPIRQGTADVPAAPKQPAALDEIAAKKSARVRTLVKYGMTVSQG